MQPDIDLAGISLKTFGISFALAWVAVGALATRRFRELGKSSDYSYELVFAALAGGLVGSRLYYVVENYDRVKDDLLGGLFGGSGLVWYGGVIGGALAVLAWARWRGLLDLGLLDLCAPLLALGNALGRIGCQVSGDGDYGITSSLPWAMGYPHGQVPTPPEVTVQPTPIYETLTLGLVALWLWRRRDDFRPGILFAWYLVLAGVERLLVEFIRRNHEVVAGLTTAQLESIVLLAAGATWLVLAGRRGGLAMRSVSRSAPV
ncbi:MAG: prolipoprotein diacylglyceryl transferase [Actinomycetota bacterium]|nr:prolipoprotein diacylglyceryl transferase [Actinomycetota bacterium]